jgi:CRP-like cAMP-binding protein
VEYSALLKEQVFRVHPLDDDAFDALSKPWEEVSYGRKQLITRAGETEKYLYLVIEGIQRAYFQHGDKEPTLVFSFCPSFSGVIDSFFTQMPSKFQLETLTQSKLIRIHYNDLNSLMLQYRSIESWVRIATTWVLAGTLERQVELMAYTAEEKFTALLKRSPHVLNLIPHKYLASYIGVDPATFSKLLGSVKL